MKLLVQDVRAGRGHSARLITGDVHSLTRDIIRELSVGGEMVLYPYVRDVFHIADSRLVRTDASRKTEGRTVFIIAASVFIDAAQHALLKVVEELGEGMTLLLITPSPETLLPTLRSRLELVLTHQQSKQSTAQAFLMESPAQRLATIGRLLDTPEHEGVRTLMQELSAYAIRTSRADILEPLSVVHPLLVRHPVGMKALLEHLALALP